jgi:twinkle protein
MTPLHEDIRSRALSIRRFGDQAKMPCPSCSETRQPAHRREPVMSVKFDTDRLLYRCWHCGIQGLVPLTEPHSEGTKTVPTKQAPKAPLSSEPDPITDAALAWLERERGIPRELAQRVGLCSGSRWIRKLGTLTPCVGFPYREGGKTYAVKWRSFPEKGFTQDGAAQTLFLADMAPIGGDLVLAEGEIDALSFHAAGTPAVSIPAGGIEEGEREDTSRLRWIGTHDALLAGAKRIYLALDADNVGGSTARELARRLGKGRCYQIEYPPGTKDANDVLVQHGPEAVSALLRNATPWPVEGLRSVAEIADRVMQLYERGLPPGLSTTWPEVDKHFTVAPGMLVMVTGIPGSGKSSWLDDLLMRMMLRHQFRVAYASFENPVDIHVSKLLQLWRLEPFGRNSAARMSQASVEEGLTWLNERCAFIDMDETPTPAALWERFDACVRRLGINAAVIDPVNFLRMDGEGDTESVNRFLAEAKLFAKSREITLFIVAHPAKPLNPPPDWVPTGYSISGSAHYFNRADFGLTIARRRDHTELHIWKARFAHQGKLGMVKLVFDPATTSYEVQRDPVLSAPKHWQDDEF